LSHNAHNDLVRQISNALHKKQALPHDDERRKKREPTVVIRVPVRALPELKEWIEKWRADHPFHG